MNEISEALKRNADDAVIIHFVCSKCKSEQVSYAKEAVMFMSEFTKDGGTIMESSCTVCKSYIGWIPLERVVSIEV